MKDAKKKPLFEFDFSELFRSPDRKNALDVLVWNPDVRRDVDARDVGCNERKAEATRVCNIFEIRRRWWWW